MEQGRTHPILIAAGVAVMLFSLIGAAALTGVLPSANTREAGPETHALAQSHAMAQGRYLPPESTPPRGKVAGAPACANCGVIEAIRPVEVKGESTGVGAVAGGVAGGLLGNQFGHGSTRTLLTVGGAAGGAFAGDAVEKNMKKRTAWRVTVRLDNGTRKTLSQRAQPPFMVGERVRIVDGAAIERA